MNIRFALIGAAALGIVSMLPIATASAAPVHPTPHAQFCSAWARFGDTPVFHNFITAHRLAPKAGKQTAGDYQRFERQLLAGVPHRQLRAASDNVWHDCGH